LKINYIEESFKTNSLFKDERVFDPEFIPNKLLHRENELILISRMFLPLIKNPNTISKKIIITGNIGVGKTITVHFFGKMLEESAKKRNLNLFFVHINCRAHRTSHLILKNIIERLGVNLPIRGLSSIELLEIIIGFLVQRKGHLIIVLDEMNYINKKEKDFIYTLTRINENRDDKNYYISIIGIVKDLGLLRNFDDAIRSTLQNEVIHFRKYNVNEIFDIIMDRVKIGLKDGVISHKLVKVICELSKDSGDIRKALKILKNAVLYAEHKGLNSINIESIRVANSEFFSISREQFNLLNYHEILILKAISDLLQNHNKDHVIINEIKEEYVNLCLERGVRPRSNTQIWEYIQTLKRYDFIQSKIINKNVKGRKCIIEISNYSINKLNKELEAILNDK